MPAFAASGPPRVRSKGSTQTPRYTARLLVVSTRSHIVAETGFLSRSVQYDDRKRWPAAFGQRLRPLHPPLALILSQRPIQSSTTTTTIQNSTLSTNHPRRRSQIRYPGFSARAPPPHPPPSPHRRRQYHTPCQGRPAARANSEAHRVRTGPLRRRPSHHPCLIRPGRPPRGSR